VPENALNEGHRACRTKKPIDDGFSHPSYAFRLSPSSRGGGNFTSVAAIGGCSAVGTPFEPKNSAKNSASMSDSCTDAV
jgi:hypothetical protein